MLVGTAALEIDLGFDLEAEGWGVVEIDLEIGGLDFASRLLSTTFARASFDLD